MAIIGRHNHFDAYLCHRNKPDVSEYICPYVLTCIHSLPLTCFSVKSVHTSTAKQVRVSWETGGSKHVVCMVLRTVHYAGVHYPHPLRARACVHSVSQLAVTFVCSRPATP